MMDFGMTHGLIYALAVGISLLSAALLLNPRVPVGWTQVHASLTALPLLAAIVAIFAPASSLGGWLLQDRLAWGMALFVQAIGLTVLRYSMRYLLGDRYYRSSLALLTVTVNAASITWLSNDVRLLAASWGVTLLGVWALLGRQSDWRAVRVAARTAGRLFTLSFGALVLAVCWLASATGAWRLTDLRLDPSTGIAGLDSWTRAGIGLLLVLAVLIPAAQWPFQRWLLESVVTPTPVSAILHAGFVNAGGILLTRFSPLFDGGIAQIVLLILSGCSILAAFGGMLVQVDYKRQLVLSTIAQMGFMLVQCALGAYLLAIIHLVMHGLFKATLFLSAGSVVPKGTGHAGKRAPSRLWNGAGWVIGLLVGIAIAEAAPGAGMQWVIALVWGGSLTVAWRQLVAAAEGAIERAIGAAFFLGTVGLFATVHAGFQLAIGGDVPTGIAPSLPLVLIVTAIALLLSIAGFLIMRKGLGSLHARLYLWLVRLTEPRPESVESIPVHLMKPSILKGGIL